MAIYSHTMLSIFFIIGTLIISSCEGRIENENRENNLRIEHRAIPDPEEIAYNNFMSKIRSRNYGLLPRITNSIIQPRIYGNRETPPPFDINKFIEQNMKMTKPSKIFYYSHPNEEFRYEYQPMVRRTYDGEPEEFSPLSWRANRGHGFNEWGAQPIL